MSCENIFKDITAVHARLFHHRPALQGHINFFVKEFEERRGERESLRMNSSFKNISYVSDQGLPNSVTGLEENLGDLKENVTAALTLCREIAQKEDKTEKTDEPSFLETERQKRAEAWEEFMKLQCERSASVDEEVNAQVQALKEHYEDLEHKLKASKVVL